MDAYKKAGNRKDEPPKHEMVHFPGLLSSKREFGDFRTVLHTGLYSQIVAMEVPVGGDIGDEVCIPNPLVLLHPMSKCKDSLNMHSQHPRCTPLTKF